MSSVPVFIKLGLPNLSIHLPNRVTETCPSGLALSVLHVSRSVASFAVSFQIPR